MEQDFEALASDTGARTLHGTALVLRASGVLIRGRSGSGKSSLALVLLRHASVVGWFGRLVGDDRIIVECQGGRLLAQPHPAIAGRIERRASGLLNVPYQQSVIVRLIVDLGLECDKAPRLPGPRDLAARICGIELPRVVARNTTPIREVADEVMRVVMLNESIG